MGLRLGHGRTEGISCLEGDRANIRARGLQCVDPNLEQPQRVDQKALGFWRERQAGQSQLAIDVIACGGAPAHQSIVKGGDVQRSALESLTVDCVSGLF